MTYLLFVLFSYLLIAAWVYYDALEGWSLPGNEVPEDRGLVHFLALLFALTWPYQLVDWLLSRRWRK